MGVALGYLTLAVVEAPAFAVSPSIWRGGSPGNPASVGILGLLDPPFFGGLGGMLVPRFRLGDEPDDPSRATG